MKKPKMAIWNKPPSSAAGRWMDHYCHRGRWLNLGDGRDTGAIHAALIDLGPSPTAQQVAAVIGNDSWTNNGCDVCGKKAQRVIGFGDEESTLVCLECVTAAGEMLRGEPK